MLQDDLSLNVRRNYKLRKGSIARSLMSVIFAITDVPILFDDVCVWRRCFVACVKQQNMRTPFGFSQAVHCA